MEVEVKEIEIDGERVFISKSDIFGYKVVHPYKIDGKINWKNLLIGGSWWNVLIYGFLILMVLVAIHEYSTAVKIANDCLSRQIIINPNLFS